MEEKEQVSVSVSPSPSSPLSARSNTNYSSPISPTSPSSPSSPSSASLLRSTHFLLTSLRHSNPRTLDATTRAQLTQTTQLLSKLSTHVQHQHRTHKTTLTTLRRQLAQLIDERDKELERMKDESKRRRRVERQLVDDKVEQEREELTRKRHEADSTQRVQELEGELSLLHNKLKQVEEDRRYERQRLEDEVRALADKRNKYLRHYKLSQSTLHDTRQQLTLAQQEVAAAERQQAVLGEQRFREDEDRQQLVENRDEVIEANLRLLAELRQVRDSETELTILKQQWEEERARLHAQENDWRESEEERVRLQADNSAWEGKWQHIQEQSATLAELTQRMNGREEAMKEELASHWQCEKLQMEQLMYDECNKHEQQTQHWKQQATAAQHNQQLLQVELDALQQKAVEEAAQREKERSEWQQKVNQRKQQVEQLEDERKVLEQRDDEQQATIRQYIFQVRSTVDQLAVEQQTWLDEKVKHRKTVEAKDEQLKVTEDKAVQLHADLTRRQSLLSKEQQRSAALTLQLEQERQHSLTLIDPLLHQSVQLRLKQREDEVEASKIREEEQAGLVSSLRTTINALQQNQANLRVEAEKEREELRVQLRVVSEERRQLEVVVKEHEGQRSNEQRERKQQQEAVEDKLTALTAERDALRQAKDEAETERSQLQQEMEERLVRVTDEGKAQERHYTGLLNNQHTAHSAQLTDYQQRITAATQQIETLTTDITTLSSNNSTLHTQLADKDKSAALLTQQAEQAKLDKAITEQQLAAAQQHQSALQQQLFNQQQKATAADKLATRQLALLKQRHTFTEEAIVVLRTQVEDERAGAAQLEQQKREVELKAEAEKRRADELRVEVEVVESERVKAAARLPQLEREMDALRARETEYDSRLRILSVQLRTNEDEGTERNRQCESEVKAVKDEKRAVDDEVKAEREKVKECERELDRRQQRLTLEQDKVRAVAADLDEARQRNLALIDPLAHHALTLELNSVQQQLTTVQKKETEQVSLTTQLRSQLASADSSHSAYRSNAEQSQDELRASLRTSVAEKRQLELQLKEALLSSSTYKSDNERTIRNNVDTIAHLNKQVTTLSTEIHHHRDIEAVQRAQADEQHVLYQHDKQRLEQEYQRMIRHQQDEQEAALRAWEEQIAMQALEIEQLTTDCLRERQHVDDEKARVNAGSDEVRRLTGDIVPLQESNSRLQRELVVAHDKHMQLLQQHVLHAQKQESEVRQLRTTLLDQQQRITELLTRITSLSEAVVVGEEQGKAEVHERAVEVAEYSELVQRLKEELQRMQDEQTVARREMTATVDELIQDMKSQAATHEKHVSELRQQRKQDQAEQQKELQHSATTVASLRAEVGSLTANSKRLECAAVVRTEEWAAEKTAMAAETSVLSTTVTTLKSKVERVQAELDAEREMHAMTAQRMDDMVRHRGEEHAAIQSIIVTADNTHTEGKTTDNHHGNTTGRLHRRIASLTSELMEQHSEAETDSALAQHSTQLLQAQIDVLQARLREKDNQLNTQLAQLTRLQSSVRRGRLSISASNLPTLHGYSPRSSPVQSSAGGRYRSSSSERRSKDDLHWMEQKESSSELPSHSVLRVNAARVDHTTPFRLFANQEEKIDDTVASHNTKAANNKQQPLLSSFSSSFNLPPLSSASPTSDTLIHLRSELRLKAIEVDDANVTAATWERKWHDEADERARQLRQWSELLAKATDVNRELRAQLLQQDGVGKEEKRDIDADSDTSSCVEVEIEEVVGVETVPTSTLSGQAGSKQTSIRATAGRTGGRQGAAGGGAGNRQAGGGGGSGGWDRSERDDDDDDERHHRRNQSAHLPSHNNDNSYKPTTADWSKMSATADNFASRSTSPRPGSGGRHERQSDVSELRVVNEELSARLSALEENNESLRMEKERIIREQQAAMDRNVQETARALEQEQLRVRQLKLELEREKRKSGEGAAGQERRVSTERSPARQLPRSTPTSRLSSPRTQLSVSVSSSPSTSQLSIPVGSALQSTIDSLTSTVRQQSDELASLRASLRSANRDKLDMLSQLSSTQPLAHNARTTTLTAPSYSAESRLLLQLQQSETERMVLQGRLTQTQQQLTLIEEERVDRREYEEEKGKRREVEQHMLETERQLAEMEELLQLQQRETNEWKATAEEREREMESMVRREEETLELLKQLETELGQKDQHITQLKQQLQRVNTERQHEEEERQLQRQRDELELSQLSQDSDQLHVDLQAANDANSRLRREKDQVMDECERVKSEMMELKRQYSAQQRASRLYGEALEVQAQYVEDSVRQAAGRGEDEDGSGRDGMSQLLELQATSIEQLLANEQRARGQIAAIEDETHSSGEEGERKQSESKRRGTVEEEQKEERAGRGSVAVQDRVSMARETLRRLRESHEQRKLSRSSSSNSTVAGGM